MNILKDHSDEPLPKRIKISHVSGSEGPLHHHESKLFKWLLKNAPGGVKFWLNLDTWFKILQEKEVNSIKHDEIKFAVEVIRDQIEELEKFGDDDQMTVVEVLLKLLENKLFQHFFNRNFWLYCSVISDIMLKLNNAEVLLKFLRSDNLFPKSFFLKENQILFIEKAIVTFVKVIVKHSNDLIIFNEFVRIVEKSLFFKHYRDFDEFLFNKNIEKDHYLPTAIINHLQLTAKEEDTDTSKYIYRLIFQSFCKSYNNHFDMVFKFFEKILEILNFKKGETLKMSSKKNEHLYKYLEILNEVVAIIHQNASGNQDVTEISKLLQDILKLVVKCYPTPNAVTLKLIKSVISLDHRIISGEMTTDILRYVLISNDETVKNEYEEVVIAILQIFDKLRRLTFLTSNILLILDDNSLTISNDFELFSENTLNYFSRCLMNLTSWKFADVFQLFIDYFHKQDKNDYKNVRAASRLFCCFMTTLPLSEHVVSQDVLKKFIASLEKFRKVLKTIGCYLIHKEHDAPQLEAYLNMCFTWGEVYIALKYYSTSINVEFKKSTSNDWTAYNVTYIHNYLSKEQWHTIFQRIANFGDKLCRNLTEDLMLQRLKATILFEAIAQEELDKSVTIFLTLNVTNVWKLTLQDAFLFNHIPKLDEATIKFIAENLLKALLKLEKENIDITTISNSEILTKALIDAVFYKIDKSIRQKNVTTTCLSTEVYSMIKDHPENCDKITEKLVDSSQFKKTDINEKQVKKYLSILQKLPILDIDSSYQALVVLYLTALLIETSNKSVQESCETLITGIFQSNGAVIINHLQLEMMFRIIMENFENYEQHVKMLFEAAFKDEKALIKLETTVDYIKMNFNECIKGAVIFLNVISKANKTTPENKARIAEYKLQILQSLREFVATDKTYSQVEAFALLLKANLTSKELGEDVCGELNALLPTYVEKALNNFPLKTHQHGNLLLFTSILNYKSQFPLVTEEFVLNLWKKCTVINETDHVIQEFLQLVTLICTQISDKKFPFILQELLSETNESFRNGNEELFAKNIKIWVCILTCSLNPAKTKLWQNTLQQFLEATLENLSITHSVDYGILKHLLEFIVKLIQAKQTYLTPSIDVCLIIPTLLFDLKNIDFISLYDLSILTLNSLLKHRSALMMDRLPPFRQQFKVLLQKLCSESNTENKADDIRVQQLCNCSFEMEKLVKSLVSHGRDMGRVAMYFITDILQQYESITLYPKVKKHLDNCIYELISLCDEHAERFLLRILSTSSAEMFRIMHENYKRYYKFTGKV